MVGAQKIFQTFTAYLTILKVVMLIVDTSKPRKNPYCSLNANETSSFLLKGRKNWKMLENFRKIPEYQIF